MSKITDQLYVTRLQEFLIYLLNKKRMSFREIVCQSEGAYPTTVMNSLKDLIISHRVVKVDGRYCLLGSKAQPTLEQSPPQLSERVDSSTLDNCHILADPHPADYDWRYTLETRRELCNRINDCLPDDSEVALLGAPTLFYEMYSKGKNVTLFDSSASTLRDLKSAGFSHGLIQQNLFDSIPSANGKFEVAVADPPWYLPFHKAFILRSSELLKNQGLLFLSVPPRLTRPSAITDRESIIRFAVKAGFYLREIRPGALLYQCPKFEQVALSQEEINCGDWRLGDLFVFRKVKEAAPSLSVPFPSDEFLWDEFRIGNLKVKTKQKSLSESGILRILPISGDSPYLRTVSRRSPLRHNIDLWTSENAAYSINRLDIIRSVLARMQSGDKTSSIINDFSSRLSKSELSSLSSLVTELLTPFSKQQLSFKEKSQVITPLRRASIQKCYTNSVIANDILPQIDDAYWKERLTNSINSNPPEYNIHLAVFIEPYLQYIIEGRKTIESRFNIHRSAPYQKVRAGDIILLKRSSGPIIGVCEVANVWYYQLDPKAWSTIKKNFADALCIQDPEFWKSRQNASYATLLRIQNVHPIDPVNFIKHDRRGWVVLTDGKTQGEMELGHE